ncbi:MAG: hypothetical protein OXG65_03845 [Chloroflexi bacterium]|nr:hypothetical protein [Chloroflexota bacterium]
MPAARRTVTGGAADRAIQARQAQAAAARQVPYGERPARNRQLTLLAELLGPDWRQQIPARFGVVVGDLNRRQAAAAIRQLTSGVRPRHVARGTWHRVAVDPDWIERPRGSRRRRSTSLATGSTPEPSAGPLLPIQMKALRLLGNRLDMDVVTATPTRFGCDLGRLDRRTAAGWIAELTYLVLVSPAEAVGR